MGTVIIGTGIIGVSTAYYLSEPSSASPGSPSTLPIHLLDNSPIPFSSASGYAAGFLAPDWFAPSIADLGALSFHLHKSLAAEHNGAKEWGYVASTALSLVAAAGNGVKGKRGEGSEDWLLQGTSRAEVAKSSQNEASLDTDGSPNWFTEQPGYTLEKISEEGGCAQVDPKRLCDFLLRVCQERGVGVRMPVQTVQVLRSQEGCVEGVIVQDLATGLTHSIPCNNVILTAGAWTPQVLCTLFPASPLSLPISPLAGHSVVVRSPRHTAQDEVRYKGSCHAVFTAPGPQWRFAPEVFTRGGAEIWLGGLNSENLPLPRSAAEGKVVESSREELRDTARAMLGLAATAGGAEQKRRPTGEGDLGDLQVVREAVCWRPVGRGGRPVVTRLKDGQLGAGWKTDTAAQDAVAGAGGVYVAAGHGPWGISLSLGTGRVVAEMVKGERTSVSIAGLGVD